MFNRCETIKCLDRFSDTIDICVISFMIGQHAFNNTWLVYTVIIWLHHIIQDGVLKWTNFVCLLFPLLLLLFPFALCDSHTLAMKN